MLAGIRRAALALGAVLALAAFLIVANTIRLAIHARRDEVEILALVGASRAFIGTPFLLEGALQGTVGAGLSLAFLYLLFRIASALLGTSLAFLIGHGEPAFFSAGEGVVFVLAGGALGLAGSLSALASVGRSQ